MRRHQLDLMAKLDQLPRPMMRGGAGLHGVNSCKEALGVADSTLARMESCARISPPDSTSA
jgi:hypothetical protein